MTTLRKKIIILSPYPFGSAPSQRFRYEQYLSYLESNGFDIELRPFLNQKAWDILYQRGKYLKKMMIMLQSFFMRFLLIPKLINYNYVFVHREMAHFGPPIFEFLAAKVFRIKYIYDFDDAIWLANYSDSNAKFHWIKCYWKVSYCIKWASHVTVGNDYLAEYAQKYNKNVTVIPTTIDTQNHHFRQQDFQNEKVTIGWTGTITTMNYLDAIVSVIEKLEKDFDFDFVVISNRAPSFQLKSLKFIEWNKETEIADLSRLDIGLMPLVEDKWSSGKCGFKALQYMSLGIPCVASPVGVNIKIIQNGINGILATTQEDYYLALKSLLQDSFLRTKLGDMGKATVNDFYSVEANKKNYMNLFN